MKYNEMRKDEKGRCVYIKRTECFSALNAYKNSFVTLKYRLYYRILEMNVSYMVIKS